MQWLDTTPPWKAVRPDQDEERVESFGMIEYSTDESRPCPALVASTAGIFWIRLHQLRV